MIAEPSESNRICKLLPNAVVFGELGRAVGYSFGGTVVEMTMDIFYNIVVYGTTILISMFSSNQQFRKRQ